MQVFKALNKHISKFKMPEAMEGLWQICFDLSLTGQKQVKEQVSKMMA
jgi:hypothetical protein